MSDKVNEWISGFCDRYRYADGSLDAFTIDAPAPPPTPEEVLLSADMNKTIDFGPIRERINTFTQEQAARASGYGLNVHRHAKMVHERRKIGIPAKIRESVE